MSKLVYFWDSRDTTNNYARTAELTETVCPKQIFKKNFFNVYLFLRKKQSVSRGGAEREGDTESVAGFRL